MLEQLTWRIIAQQRGPQLLQTCRHCRTLMPRDVTRCGVCGSGEFDPPDRGKLRQLCFDFRGEGSANEDTA